MPKNWPLIYSNYGLVPSLFNECIKIGKSDFFKIWRWKSSITVLSLLLLFFGVGESHKKADCVRDHLRLVAQTRQVGDDLVEKEGDGPSGAFRVLPERGNKRQTKKIWPP